MKRYHDHIFEDEYERLAKALRHTFQDIYLAIVSRIAQSEEIESMNLQTGDTAVPMIMRKKSTMDQNSGDILFS